MVWMSIVAVGAVVAVFVDVAIATASAACLIYKTYFMEMFFNEYGNIRIPFPDPERDQ